MPLAHVRLQGCTELTDVSALANSKELKEIILPPNATNFEFLRNFSKLERISFQHDANTF